MKTERFELTDEWQQAGDASGTVSIQAFGGVCYVYVGDEEPEANSNVWWRLLDGRDLPNLPATANVWIKGNGFAAVITV